MTLAPDLFRSGSDIATIRSAASAFEQSLALDTHADWAAMEARRLDDGMTGEPLSDAAFEKLAEFLERIGDSVEEITGTIEMPKPVAEATSARLIQMRRSVRKSVRPLSLQSGARTIEHLRASVLPIDLRYLPQTALDPAAETLEGYGEIEPNAVARIATFRDPRLATFAAISVIIAASYDPSHRAAPQLCHHERREDLFRETGEDPFDRDAVGRVYDAYFVDKTLFPKDSDYLRGHVCRGLFYERQRALDYSSSKPGLTPAITKALPAVPAEGSRYYQTVVRASRELRLASVEKRKDHADALSDNFDDILFACRARETQTRRLKLNCDEVRALMLERLADGTHLLGAEQAFSYHERVVTPRGRRLGCLQRVHMVAHRASSIMPGGSPDDIQFEFLRVEALGIRRHDPWFVRIYATGLLLRAPSVPRAQREARRALFLALKMPERGDRPTGLLVEEGLTGGAILAAALALGLTLIPVDALAHAMLMTYVMVRVMALTMCRVGEALQLTYDPCQWKVDTVDNRKVQMFLAIPKAWEDADAYVIDDRTVRLMGVLASMRKAREGGALTKTPGSRDLDPRKHTDTVHVFAFRTRDMREKELNYMFRVMTAGLGHFTSHDIRHAAANRANEELIAMEHVKEMLRQRGDGIEQAKKYARPTQKQLAESRARYEATVLAAVDGLTQEMAA